MIHYIEGVPAKNIRLARGKRHALASYRHKQRVAAVKDIAARFAIVMTVGLILTAVYLSH
jgi:hypothetical protein